MTNLKSETHSLLTGTVRLRVTIAVSFLSFFYSAILDYMLPLYFSIGAGFSKGLWSSLVVWQFAPWCFTPILAGLLARRYGEKQVWAVALMAQALVPVALCLFHKPWALMLISFCGGISGALMWVSAISLLQVVPLERKGYANGLVMVSLGAGSLLAPLVGRAILWREQVFLLANGNDWSGVAAFLVNLTRPEHNPTGHNFTLILYGLAIIKLICAIAIWAYALRPGHFAGDPSQASPSSVLTDLRLLLSNPRFWALTIALCLIGGPMFQANNQYLRYRAEDIGLISGAQDRGWSTLQLVRALMLLPGGIAVGFFAGRRAAGIFAVVLLGFFAITCGSIGWASTVGMLFLSSACFEMVRQLMRWSQTGYLSEHMPARLRSCAIGCSVTCSGLGATSFGFLTNQYMNPSDPSFNSAEPFWLAAGIGAIGATGLYFFNRNFPIRENTAP